jgi:hypothetical protein
MASWDTPAVAAPSAANYAAPLVNFDEISKLPETYFKAKEMKRQDDVATAFRAGIPKDGAGDPNYSAMSQRMLQLGNYPQAVTFENTGIELQRMKNGAKLDGLIGPGSSSGGDASVPAAPSAPASPPRQAAPATTGGDRPGSIVGVLTDAGVPQDQIGVLAGRFSSALKVDPNAPLTAEQSTFLQARLPAIKQKFGSAPTQAASASPLPTPAQRISQGFDDAGASGVVSSAPPAPPAPAQVAGTARSLNLAPQAATAIESRLDAMPVGQRKAYLNQLATSPAFPKSVNEWAEKRLESIERGEDPTTEIKNAEYDADNKGVLTRHEATMAGAKKAATAPYEIAEAAVREGGRPISIKPNEVVATGNQVNPALAGITDWATRRLGVSSGAPAAPAPMPPATGPNPAPPNVPSPPLAPASVAQPARSAFTPQMVRNADGSVASSVTPSTETLQKTAAQNYEKARESYAGSQDVQSQLATMEDSARALNKAGWSTTGTGANARLALAKTVNSLWQSAGVKDQNLPFDPNAVASWEKLQKETTRLGFSLARTLGAREAMQIVQGAIAANPNAENSPLGFKMVLNTIRQNAERQSDYFEYATRYAQDHGSLRAPEAPFAGVTPGGVPIGPDGRPRVAITGKSESGEENPFARFDSLRGSEPRSEKSPTLRSVAMQVPTGFNEVTADTLGAPVDAVTWVLNRIPGVKIEHPFGGSESIKRGMAAVGVPNPDEVPAENTAERIARGTGGGIAGMLVPEAVVGGLAKTGAMVPQAVETAQRVFGRSEGAGDLAKAATVGATAGGTGEVAAELAPEKLKPVARVVGNVAGGVGGALAAEAPRLAVDAARGARDYVAPMSQAGQEATAGATLRDRASNPADVVDTLDNGPHELIPGSRPTLFQATGDMGLGALEREVQTRNPGDFQQRRAEQNAARVDALSGIQPHGNPADVSAALRRQLADIDQTTSNAIERATQDARTQSDAIGGTVPPEQRGSALRAALQDAENAARAHEEDLWRAVDPEGRLAISMGPVQAAADRVYGDLTAAARAGLTSTERTILQVMSGYKAVEPFKELADLRSAVSSAMRYELRNVGRSPAYGRLAAFRAGIEDSIGSAVEHVAAQEAHAVVRGEMSPEATVAANIRRQIDEWRSARSEATGTGDSGGASASPTGRTSSISRPSRTTRQGGGRFADAAGDQGVSLTPNFDQAARERLTEATAATNERARRYGQGPAGQALRTQGQKGNYQSLDASVPDTFFRPGPKGFEAVQALGRAVGDEHAHTMLADTAAASLRQFAMRPDGTLDPIRFASWRQKYADALRALPEDLAAQFENAANATDAIGHVAQIRKEALEAYQKTAIGKLIEARHPDDVVKIVGSIFSGKNPVGSMRELVTETANDPAAREGLRKAVADYITSRFISNTEAAASGQSLVKADAFQTFVKQHNGALRQVLAASEYNLLKAIASDLRRSNRSLTAVRLPGQSNTAQDALPQLRKSLEPGAGSLLLELLVGASTGYGAGGVKGGLGGVATVLGRNVLGRMREAGMTKVDDLIRQAMLDPELARLLLGKAPAKPDTGSAMTIAHRLRRLSVYAPTQGAEKKEDR